MQADVRSAVPRTAPVTRNLISVGRANEASSHEYAPQKYDRPHTRAIVALRTAISKTCYPTLSVLAEGGMGMTMCNVSESVHLCCNQKQPHILHICTRAEEGERRVSVAMVRIYHGHGLVRLVARARVAVFHPFLSFLIDAPKIYLFKLIELFFELPVWY
jgi:hypothetical protein